MLRQSSNERMRPLTAPSPLREHLRGDSFSTRRVLGSIHSTAMKALQSEKEAKRVSGQVEDELAREEVINDLLNWNDGNMKKLLDLLDAPNGKNAGADDYEFIKERMDRLWQNTNRLRDETHVEMVGMLDYFSVDLTPQMLDDVQNNEELKKDLQKAAFTRIPIQMESLFTSMQTMILAMKRGEAPSHEAEERILRESQQVIKTCSAMYTVLAHPSGESVISKDSSICIDHPPPLQSSTDVIDLPTERIPSVKRRSSFESKYVMVPQPVPLIPNEATVHAEAAKQRPEDSLLLAPLPATKKPPSSAVLARRSISISTGTQTELWITEPIGELTGTRVISNSSRSRSQSTSMPSAQVIADFLGAAAVGSEVTVEQKEQKEPIPLCLAAPGNVAYQEDEPAARSNADAPAPSIDAHLARKNSTGKLTKGAVKTDAAIANLVIKQLLALDSTSPELSDLKKILTPSNIIAVHKHLLSKIKDLEARNSSFHGDIVRTESASRLRKPEVKEAKDSAGAISGAENIISVSGVPRTSSFRRGSLDALKVVNITFSPKTSDALLETHDKEETPADEHLHEAKQESEADALAPPTEVSPAVDNPRSKAASSSVKSVQFSETHRNDKIVAAEVQLDIPPRLLIVLPSASKVSRATDTFDLPKDAAVTGFVAKKKAVSAVPSRYRNSALVSAEMRALSAIDSTRTTPPSFHIDSASIPRDEIADQGAREGGSIVIREAGSGGDMSDRSDVMSLDAVESRISKSDKPLTDLYHIFSPHLSSVNNARLLKASLDCDSASRQTLLVSNVFASIYNELIKVRDSSVHIGKQFDDSESAAKTVFQAYSIKREDGREVLLASTKEFLTLLGHLDLSVMIFDVNLLEFRVVFESLNVEEASVLPALVKSNQHFADAFTVFTHCQSRSIEFKKKLSILYEFSSQYKLNANDKDLGSSRVVVVDTSEIDQLEREKKELEEELALAYDDVGRLKKELFQLGLEKDRTPSALLFFAALNDMTTTENLQQLSVQLKKLRDFVDCKVHFDFVDVRKRLQTCLSSIFYIDKFLSTFNSMHRDWTKRRLAVFEKRVLTSDEQAVFGSSQSTGALQPMVSNEIKVLGNSKDFTVKASIAGRRFKKN